MANSHRILIVEDDPLQAMDLELAMQDAGFTVVGIAKTRISALLMIGELAFDFAVLDYNLGSDTSRDAAELLAGQNVPFVYVTGRGEQIQSKRHADPEKIFRKPYDQRSLIAFVVDHLG